MKFPAKGGSDFEIVPAGSHLAVCNMIVDMGMQPGSGQYPDPKPQVHLRFEIPEEIRDFNGKEAPMVIGRTFTASMSTKANLRKFVEGWRGKAFQNDDEAENYELNKLGGQAALITVQHAERGAKTYANIASAGPLPKGMKKPASMYNELLIYSLEKPDSKVLAQLPKWLREKIAKRLQPEPAGEPIDSGVTTGDGDDDSIPF